MTINKKISQLKKHPNNPRIIKDEKYKKLLESLKGFPEMLTARPLVCNKKLQVIGGNQRLSALKELKVKEIGVVIVDWSEEKQKEFMIKDNAKFGDWDWDALANEWDSVKLESWGVDAWLNMDDLETKDSFELSEGKKEPFQQMKFILSDVQVDLIKDTLSKIKKTEDYKNVERFGNENGNGNALYLIFKKWVERKK
tara:strand:+ start:1529 stop:2119 length:591 start_codon:yes stop_codon:yes gene_type:complete